jgi:hypothetical protein
MPKSSVTLTIFSVLFVPTGMAQEVPVDRGKDAKELAKAEVERFAFAFAERSDVTLELHAAPVLRYTNPLRGDVQSSFFVWTHRGRPEVVASVNCWHSPREYLGLAATSLATERIVGTRDGQEIWRPRNAGIELRAVPGAPAPGETPAGRMRQMGTIASQFKADFKREARYEEGGPLRLLTRPLYRYESESDQVQDGALFALADGTSPQLNLLIEARQTKSGYEWQYALAPNNSVRYRVFHKDILVWSLPQLAPPWPNSKNPTNAYAVFPDLQNQDRTRELADELAKALAGER